MKNRKRSIIATILCINIFFLFLNGCGKKDDDSTAIAITPTPSDTTVAASETPTSTPSVSTNDTTSSMNSGGTSTSFVASGNTTINSSLSGNSTDSANKITGTIVAASMNDVTVRTSEGVEYTCSTTNAINNLTDGITLGNNITVTLSSMSATNGLYTATELNEISSLQSDTDMGVDSIENTVDDGTDSSGIYDNSQYTDGTYDNNTYDNTIYDDTTTYDDSTTYDTSGEEYYYYDPASEVYDDSAAY